MRKFPSAPPVTHTSRISAHVTSPAAPLVRASIISSLGCSSCFTGPLFPHLIPLYLFTIKLLKESFWNKTGSSTILIKTLNAPPLPFRVKAEIIPVCTRYHSVQLSLRRFIPLFTLSATLAPRHTSARLPPQDLCTSFLFYLEYSFLRQLPYCHHQWG